MTENNPRHDFLKISIIIPVYNMERFLRRAFESLRCQSIGFDNLQVIFADDCSFDKSWEIVSEYAETYDNVECVRLSQNSGVGGAPRNAALGLVKAKYFMCLDPDDELTFDACQLLYSGIEKSNVSFAFGYFSEMDVDGVVFIEKTKGFDVYKKRNYVFPQDLRFFLGMGGFFTRIYRTALVRENGLKFPEGIPGEDMVFSSSYTCVSKSALYINKPVYKYTRNPGSISYSYSKRYFMGLNQAYKIFYELLNKHEYTVYFPYNCIGFLTFCFNKLLESKLPNDEIEEIFDATMWLWDHCASSNIRYWSECAEIICMGVPGKRYALFKIIKKLQQYQLELEDKIMQRDRVLNYKIIRMMRKFYHLVKGKSPKRN